MFFSLFSLYIALPLRCLATMARAARGVVAKEEEKKHDRYNISTRRAAVYINVRFSKSFISRVTKVCFISYPSFDNACITFSFVLSKTKLF